MSSDWKELEFCTKVEKIKSKTPFSGNIFDYV